MLKYLDKGNEIKGWMIEAFDQSVTKDRVLVSGLLTEEGQEDYHSLFRDTVHNFNEEWLAEELQKSNRVAHAESPSRQDGAAARAVSPETIKALVKGEFSRYYCIAVCRMAITQKASGVVVYYADEIPIPEECRNYDGLKINTQAVLDSLQQRSLDEFLDLPAHRRTSSFCVRLP